MSSLTPPRTPHRSPGSDASVAASDSAVESIDLGGLRPAVRPGVDECPPDLEAVRACLVLLGKAVRCFQTLPASSPICAEAIAAAHAALSGLTLRERLAFRVGRTSLTIDEVVSLPLEGSEGELARRLQRAQVATVEIACSASPAELSRFCADLGTFREGRQAAGGFAKAWAKHGSERILVRTALRPVVIDAGTPPTITRRLLDTLHRQRQEQLAEGGPMYHLIPPQRGWVRIDPSVTYEAISLPELTLLLDDPVELAVVMTRLTDEDADASAIDPQTAFADRFRELASLFASVDPQVAELLFSKLARSLLNLDEGRRIALLRQTVLPGLLDGALEGSVLSRFPDVELADALCLLLDLETAAPELLAAAVDRLGLPMERREALEPLLRSRLQRRPLAHTGASGPDDVALERYALRLLAVDPSVPRHFGEYAAFDLTVTEQTIEATRQVAQDIAMTDATDARLGTICQVLRVATDPDKAVQSLEQVAALLVPLGQQGRWNTFAVWCRELHTLTGQLQRSRPDVAAAIAATLRGLWTPENLAALAADYGRAGLTPDTALALLDACGSDLTAAILTGLDAPATADRARALLPLLGDHAAAVAPQLPPQLATASRPVRLAIVRLLGRAGTAYGAKLAAMLATGDDETRREVLQALSDVGSTTAAITVARHIVDGPPSTRDAAVATLLDFPPDHAQPRIRELLANLDFVRRHPTVALRLLDHVRPPDSPDLAHTLRALTALRFHLWNPTLVRVANRAARLRGV